MAVVRHEDKNKTTESLHYMSCIQINMTLLFIVSNFTVSTVDWKSFAVKGKAF